jgi:hypothetical protein
MAGGALHNSPRPAVAMRLLRMRVLRSVDRMSEGGLSNGEHNMIFACGMMRPVPSLVSVRPVHKELRVFMRRSLEATCGRIRVR